MGLFGKNKNNGTENAEKIKKTETPENINTVYRDGVFEVYEDKNDGKKYGRILKYHGSEKIIEVSEEEFSLWKDAADNFGKYRITYERDEEYFIEKASIELATEQRRGVEGKESGGEISSPDVPDEEKEYRKELVEFYNAAVQSQDHGEKMLDGASFDEIFCTAALAERKINEIVAAKKKEVEESVKNGAERPKKLEIQIPEQLGKLAEFSKKKLYQSFIGLEKIYVIYSDVTGYPHSAGGSALIALCEETAEKMCSELASHSQKASSRMIPCEKIPGELKEILQDGYLALRFGHKYGGVVNIPINRNELSGKIEFFENIRLRAAMINFFQAIKNGVSPDKLKGAELMMYDAMFKATYIQPCVKRSDGNITVSIVKNDKGACLLELYTCRESLETSGSYNGFRSDDPENTGFRKMTFEDILKEVNSAENPANGFVIDRNHITQPYAGKILENIIKCKEIWDKNGGTFEKKE